MCGISTFAQNKTILELFGFLGFFFWICKCSSFLLVQTAKGCFSLTGTGIPPLSVHSLPVEGLYQESWIHKEFNFELLFKFLSFLNDVERLQFCGPERLSMFCIRTPLSTPLQMAAYTLVSNPCQWYLGRQNLNLLFKTDADIADENMQYQFVHKVSSRLRLLEEKNKIILHYLTNKFQKEPDFPVQGIYEHQELLKNTLFANHDCCYFNNVQTETHLCWLGIQNTLIKRFQFMSMPLTQIFFFMTTGEDCCRNLKYRKSWPFVRTENWRIEITTVTFFILSASHKNDPSHARH